MSAPTFSSVFYSGAGTGDVTVDVSSGDGTDWSDGDTFLMLVEDADEAVATPTGWTAVPNSPQSAVLLTRLTAFTKTAHTGDTTFTVTDPGDHSCVRIGIVKGARGTGSLFDLTNGGNKLVASMSLSVPGGTTSTNNCLVLVCVTRDNDAVAAAFSNWANADLSGLTEVIDSGTNQGNGGGIAVLAGTKAVAGAFGATTADIAVLCSNAYMNIVFASESPPAAAPTLVSTEWIADALHDGVVLRTVWSAAVTNTGAPTFSCAARSITNAAMKYKTGSGTTTIDWWVTDANNRIFTGNTVTASFGAGTVDVSGTGNDAITNTATTNSSAAAAYAPTYGRSGPLRLYADIHGNGDATVYTSPVRTVVEFGPSEVDTLAHFQTAAATKLPSASASGVVLLNLEALMPASGNYADFDTDASWPANLLVITSIFTWARATYANMVFVPYPLPNLYSSIAGAGDSAARATRLLYASRSYSAVEVIGYANGMSPEFFDRDPTMTQAQMDAYAGYAMDLARSVNTLAFPRVVRPIYPVVYLNLPETPFTDFSAQRIAVSVRALQRAGADGVIYAGSESLKTAGQWQRDAQTRQRSAFTMVGLVGSIARRARGRRR